MAPPGELARELRSKLPELKCLMLTSYTDEQAMLDAHAAAALMARLRDSQAKKGPLADLSEQEKTLLELIGEGLTNRQISERMFLAEKTVKNYVSRLLAKLGMERRTQAAVLATELRKQNG